MHSKRTTAPDELPGPIGSLDPPPRTHRVAARLRGLPPRATARAVVGLARNRRRLQYRPTLAQVQMMVRFDGREPCSYVLDPAVNFMPEAAPVGFPSGPNGLCFVHGRYGEMVVAPDGTGFSLT
jgi:hypothetical protein